MTHEQLDELEDLLTELYNEIKDLLKTHSSSEVTQILAEHRRYRRSFYNKEEQ